MSYPCRTDCDEDEDDCDAENPKRHKVIYHKEVETEEGYSHEPHGKPKKIKLPLFNPKPKEEKVGVRAHTMLLCCEGCAVQPT